MIKFENTYFTYNEKPLICGFSLHIQKGDKVVLYGPSGSGKSTLLHAILGFTSPDCGKITINKTPVEANNITKIRNQTSWLPQDLSLPAETVKDLIYMPFNFKSNQQTTPSEKTILNIFQRLGLETELLTKQANEISGGQRQRILLASTTLLNKPILLLDEPTAALDHKSVDLVIEYLKSLKNTTMIAVSHDKKFISSFDKKILINR